MSEEGSYNQGGWRWQDARGCCWDVRDCVRGAWREYGPWWARSWRAGAATFADERIREKAGGFGPRRLPGRLQAGVIVNKPRKTQRNGNRRHST